MYYEKEKVLLTSIDHGFSSIKLPFMVFDNGVDELSTDATFDRGTLKFNGKIYKVGEGRNHMKDVKTEDEDYFILTLAAIAEDIQRNVPNYDYKQTIDVVIAAGLPFKRFGVERDSFKKYLERGKLSFRYEGKSFHINIRKVLLYPQCYAAVANILSRLEENELIVDIGSKTIDIIKCKNHVPVEKDCDTIPEALIKCMAEMNKQVYAETGHHLREDDMQKIIMGMEVLIPEDALKSAQRYLREFATTVEAYLKERGHAPQYTPIIYVGGGATVMKLYGTAKGSHIRYQEDIRANAIGYEYLANQRKQGWLNERI